jgi:DNA-binding transcriptional LysR family regulator
MNEYDALIHQGGLSLERLATLCRVADAGGLSRAAGGDVSRLSLYSRQLKDLESFFGAALTRKVGRTVVLTEGAHALAAKVRGQFRELAAFREEAGMSAPVLHIGASHSICEWWLWPRLGALANASAGDSHIRMMVMRSADLVHAVENRVLDIALVRSDAVPRTLKSRPAFSMPYSLFVPQRLNPGKALTADFWNRVPLALSLGGQIRERIEAGAAGAGINLGIRLECPSFSLAAKAVASGAYAAILPDLAQTAFTGHRVKTWPLPFPGVSPRKISLAWHPQAPASRLKLLQRVLIDAV